MPNKTYPVAFLNERHTTVEERFPTDDDEAMLEALNAYTEVLSDPELVSVEIKIIGKYKNDAVLVETCNMRRYSDDTTEINGYGHVVEPKNPQAGFDLYNHLCDSLRIEVNTIDNKYQYIDLRNDEGNGETITLTQPSAEEVLTPESHVNNYG